MTASASPTSSATPRPPPTLPCSPWPTRARSPPRERKADPHRGNRLLRGRAGGDLPGDLRTKGLPPVPPRSPPRRPDRPAPPGGPSRAVGRLLATLELPAGPLGRGEETGQGGLR